MCAQSCPTLCNPVDCGPPGSSVHGIFQARILEWVAISFSRGPSWPRDWSPCLLHWQADCLSLCHLGSPLATVEALLFCRFIIYDTRTDVWTVTWRVCIGCYQPLRGYPQPLLCLCKFWKQLIESDWKLYIETD